MDRKIIDKELLKKILFKVRRPAQYIGSEINSIIKKDYKVLIIFIFPDTYEVGMSHLGGTILYNIINKVADVSCQRAYMPSVDMLEQHKLNNLPIFSLEEKIDIATSNSVMFSLLYEFNITNVLEMLHLSKIPVYSNQRTEADPIVIAGGSIMINPRPISPFFDCIVIGDGEEVVVEIAEILKLDVTRFDKLIKLSHLEGVWVPSIATSVVKFRRVKSLSSNDYPTKRIVPNIKPIHDRISVEVMRGCVRGCRYCNAGMIYRPFREKSLHEIFTEVVNTHQNSGFDEVGYLSLSTTDYSNFDSLVLNTIKLKNKMGINFSIPSTRLDKLPIEMEDMDFAKNSLTLAPECGTDTLRMRINKNIKNIDIIDSVDFAYKNGWQTIKLYFMVGLPGETSEDVQGIVDLVNSIKGLAYKYSKFQKTSISVSLGAFTPRPLTPFQWSEFQDVNILLEKFKFVKSSLRDRKIKISYRDPYVSLLETILVRGDETVANIIYEVWKNGGILQAWEEHLDKRLWLDAIERLSFDSATILSELDTDVQLPWDFIDSGVNKEYLKEEYLKSKEVIVTTDCKYDACSDCGVCVDGLSNIEKKENFDVDQIIPDYYKIPNKRVYLRIYISQLEDSVYLSNKDFRDIVKKSLIVAGIPLVYSEGFAHKLRASFSDPNNFGVFSECEMADFESAIDVTSEHIEKANNFLNNGIKILSFKTSLNKFKESINEFTRSIFFIQMYSEYEYNIFKEKIQDKNLFYKKKNKKGKVVDINILDRINSIKYDDLLHSIEIEMYTSGEKSLRFDLLFETTNGKNWLEICKVVKKEVFFTQENQ